MELILMTILTVYEEGGVSEYTARSYIWGVTSKGYCSPRCSVYAYRISLQKKFTIYQYRDVKN